MSALRRKIRGIKKIKTSDAKKTSKITGAAKKVEALIKEKPSYQEDFIKEHIVSTKYYTREEPRYQEPPFEFPSCYGDNRMVAITRDPWWIFAYWEVSADIENRIRKRIIEERTSPGKSILRVYDITDKIFDGRNANSYFDIDLRDFANNWYIHVGQPNRSWCVDIGILANNGRLYTLARSNVVNTPRFGPSDVIDEEWMIPEEDFWKLFGLSGGFGVGKGSLEMREMFKKRLKEQLWSGGLFSGVFSFQEMKKKGFWLVADCELIVYGATEPDATVTVQGNPIKLRKDGTFTLRFALPDGRHEIPVVAVSKDKSETRTITPVVTRKTE